MCGSCMVVALILTIHGCFPNLNPFFGVISLCVILILTIINTTMLVDTPKFLASKSFSFLKEIKGFH